MSLGRKRSRRVTVCLRCRNLKLHEARGLCKCCYNHLAEHRCRTGEHLDDYPTLGGGVGTSGAGRGAGDTGSRRRDAPHTLAPSQILADRIRDGDRPDDLALHITVQGGQP